MNGLKGCRNDFPVLLDKIDGKLPIYLDNACMTLKPEPVLDEICNYYHHYPACGGRSFHKFGKIVSQKVDESRVSMAKLINGDAGEIIFTKNCTEALNLLANSINFKEDSIILTTDKEHNSNFLPWRRLEQTKAIKQHIFVDAEKILETIEDLHKKGEHLSAVSLCWVSNLDGTFFSDDEIISIGRTLKLFFPEAVLILDAAQAVMHKPVDVKKLPVDFIAFSVHKIMGPTGLGVLWGKRNLLEKLKPFMTGGGTVERLDSKNMPVYLDIPERLEGGLQHYAGICGAKAAAEYIIALDPKEIDHYESDLNKYATEKINKLDSIEIIGPLESEKRSGILTFYFRKPVTKHDDSELDVDEKLSNSKNIMIRKGLFCVYSWYSTHRDQFYKIMSGFEPMFYRASFAAYNTKKEIDQFINELENVADGLSDLPDFPKISVKGR